MSRLGAIAGLLVVAAGLAPAAAAFSGDDRRPAIDRRPDAIVDLRTEEGAALVGAQWRWSNARIVEVEHRAPGPDRKPSGPPNRTHDLEPKAGAAGFDDSGWEVLAPPEVETRRSDGRLCFGWYRLRFTVPEKIGALPVAGSTLVFEIVVDDYAEVWVDGQLPKALGQVGGSLVAGFNAPNRVVVTRDAKPGTRYTIAVLAANGPLSNPPGNFLWVRSATLDVHTAAAAKPGREVATEIVRVAPALDALVPPDSRIEKLAGGFEFSEGPVWHPDGYLLFSDPNANRIYRWSADDGVSVFRTKSGYSGADIALFRQPGSNGLGLDAEGRLVICEHGNRRVTRLERDGSITVLADRFEGKRLNSPNDVILRSDGTLFFSDPPFGLPKFHDDPRRELPVTGVYCLRDGKLTLATADLTGPNGVAFSPDERSLYVTDWDPKMKVVMRYAVAEDGTLSDGRVFFDMGAAPYEEALDGLEVDARGNLYVSGPGGIWVLSASGEHLGTIRGPELPANFAWGEDGRTLFLTARTGLYRLRVSVPGSSFATRPRDASAGTAK